MKKNLKNIRPGKLPDGMLTFREAAAYLHTTRDYLHRLVYLGKLSPDIRCGARKYFRRGTLDAYLAANESRLSPEVPEGYITTADLLAACQRLNQKGYNKPRSHGRLSGYLKGKEVPHLHILAHKNGGDKVVWLEEAAWDVLQDYIARSRPEENHCIAPPEILKSGKWVTCRRAAELIGCTPEEISARAVKYSFRSYLHPETKRLLVNWLEVKERMKWRRPFFIVKHLGAAGYKLVKRTCECQRGPYGTIYRVPELLGAELSCSERRVAEERVL